ncbi:MAG: tetratricopeptide repeat protein [Desulfobacteraceae bacterium]|nr:tetratricopeptide repeat protein [Desulfobacteraceae bacterium]
MGLFSIFSGKKPEAIEKKGDRHFDQRAFGPAKLEYEKAAAKNDTAPSDDPGFKERILEKIARSKHELALQHTQKAGELMEAGCFAEAGDRLSLAMSLTEDPALEAEILTLTDQVNASHRVDPGETIDTTAEDADPSDLDMDESEYFTALLNALPPEELEAYPGYGSTFAKGFIAMNQGDFATASTCFETALSDNGPETSFIHLELATCRLNQNDPQGAKELALAFLDHLPASTRGWQILCEALWGLDEFDLALEHLDACPDAITKSSEIEILRGETLIQSNEIEKAEALYHSVIKAGNRDVAIVRHLAGTCELLDKPQQANDLYTELMNRCTSCGTRPDPNLNLRYAETCMALGEPTDQILDIYLELATQDPANRSYYFTRVSEIYSKLGNETQAERFRQFAAGREEQN